MITEQGVITSVAQQAGAYTVEVMTRISSTCGSCAQQQHCATSAVAIAVNDKAAHHHLTWHGDSAPQVGDIAVLQIPEKTLLQASFVQYVWPLLLLITTLWGLRALQVHELLAFISALSVALFSLWRTAQMTSSQAERWQPIITEIISKDHENQPISLS